jgi:hypothetical protein
MKVLYIKYHKNLLNDLPIYKVHLDYKEELSLNKIKPNQNGLTKFSVGLPTKFHVDGHDESNSCYAELFLKST